MHYFRNKFSKIAKAPGSAS